MGADAALGREFGTELLEQALVRWPSADRMRRIQGEIWPVSNRRRSVS